MILLPNLVAAAALVASPVPAACKLHEAVDFTGTADLPDGQVLTRILRTSVQKRAYSNFVRFERGSTWVRPVEKADKPGRVIKLRFSWTWDDASDVFSRGPRRGDLFLLKINDGDVTGSVVDCPSMTP